MRKALVTTVFMCVLILMFVSCATTEKAEKQVQNGAETQQNKDVGITKAIFEEYFAKNSDDYQVCFMTAYKKGTIQPGTKYYTYFTILADGTVGHAEQAKKHPPIDDPELESCIVKSIKKIVYPKLKVYGMLKIAKPIVFNIKNNKE